MSTLLKNLKINTIGSVDYPANPQAKVTLMKRGDTPEGAGTGITITAPTITVSDTTSPLDMILSKVAKLLGIGKEEHKMTIDDNVKKSLPEAVQKYLKDLEDKASKVDDLEKKASKVDELEKRVQDLQTELDTLQKNAGAGSDGKGDSDKQAVFKSLPEEVKKYIQDVEKRAKDAEEIAKKEREERITKEFIAKAAQFKAIAVKPEEFGPVLKSISEYNADVYSKLEAVLKAANEVVEKSKLFESIGKSTSESGSVWAQIESKANEIVQKNASMTKEQAVAKILRENPNLYVAYQQELMGE